MFICKALHISTDELTLATTDLQLITTCGAIGSLGHCCYVECVTTMWVEADAQHIFVGVAGMFCGHKPRGWEPLEEPE